MDMNKQTNVFEGPAKANQSTRSYRACTWCRAHKRKCDGLEPCTTCANSSDGRQCTYAAPKKRGRKIKRSYDDKLSIEHVVRKRQVDTEEATSEKLMGQFRITEPSQPEESLTPFPLPSPSLGTEYSHPIKLLQPAPTRFEGHTSPGLYSYSSMYSNPNSDGGFNNNTEVPLISPLRTGISHWSLDTFPIPQEQIPPVRIGLGDNFDSRKRKNDDQNNSTNFNFLPQIRTREPVVPVVPQNDLLSKPPQFGKTIRHFSSSSPNLFSSGSQIGKWSTSEQPQQQQSVNFGNSWRGDDPDLLVSGGFSNEPKTFFRSRSAGDKETYPLRGFTDTTGSSSSSIRSRSDGGYSYEDEVVRKSLLENSASPNRIRFGKEGTQNKVILNEISIMKDLPRNPWGNSREVRNEGLQFVSTVDGESNNMEDVHNEDDKPVSMRLISSENNWKYVNSSND